MSPPDVALFVDWDNLKIELGKKGQSPAIRRLREIAGRHGRVVIAKAYADWSAGQNVCADQYELYVEGIEPVYVPCRAPDGRPVKNSADVKMSADCLDVSYSNPNVGVFVLASGDRDFLHVADSLRRRGLRVVVVGVRGSTAVRLRGGVDATTYCDDPVPSPAVPAPAVPAPPVLAPTVTAPRPAELAPVFLAMRRVLADQRRAGVDPLTLSQFKPLLKTAMGNVFDEGAYGMKRFKDVVLAAEAKGLVRLMVRNGVDYVALAEGEKPAPKTAVSPGLTSAPPLGDAERPIVVTTDAILGELVRTYVELAKLNLVPCLTVGGMQRYSLRRAKRTAPQLPNGLTHSKKLEGIDNGTMGKHIANAIREGVFKLVEEAEGEATRSTLRLVSEHRVVRQTLGRPIPLASSAFVGVRSMEDESASPTPAQEHPAATGASEKGSADILASPNPSVCGGRAGSRA